MDLTLFLVIYLVGAAFNIHGIFARSTDHGIPVREKLDVACDRSFTINCIINSSDECTWNRHGTFVKSGDNRYSFRNESLQDGSTLCLFSCSQADKIDGGQWTCGTPGNDKRNGIISKIFTINVLAEYGFRCNPVTTTATPVLADYPTTFPATPDYDEPQLSNSTWIIIVGALCSVVLILIAGVIIWICLRRKRDKTFTKVETEDAKESSLHDYEYIESNGGYLPPLPRARTIPKITHGQELPTVFERYQEGQFEIPTPDRNSSLNPTDSDFIFKLIAVRKTKDESSIDLVNGIELASFKNQSTQPSSTHPYQNIRHVAQIH